MLEIIFIQPIYAQIIYFFMIFWMLFSIWYIYLKQNVNTYFIDAIPSVFTTAGVVGTFVGIFFGLQDFDVGNIKGSIPMLLEGLKTAFLTSIVGIGLSFFFSRLVEIKLNKIDREEKPKSELLALNDISKTLNKLLENQINSENLNKENFEKIINKNFDSLGLKIDKQIQAIENVENILGGDSETSLLIQFQKLREEQNNYSKLLKENVSWIVENMDKNSKLMSTKFSEFANLLAKNNTEALVHVMKSATEEFNLQMKELIDKLVKENFKELNNSVNNLNSWQKENKEMILSLTEQFRGVSTDFKVSSKSIEEITNNTSKLTNENSDLSKIVMELQRVMVDDNQFENISNTLLVSSKTLEKNINNFDNSTSNLVKSSDLLENHSKELSQSTEIIKVSVDSLNTSTDNLSKSTTVLNDSTDNFVKISKLTLKNISELSSTVEMIKSNILAFEATTNRLNKWVKNQMNFTDSVAKLLVKLEDVEKIKDINEVFWRDTKKELNSSVDLIRQANESLSQDIENINSEFYNRLSSTFSTLDELFSRMLENRR